MLIPITENNWEGTISQAIPYFERCLEKGALPHTIDDVLVGIASGEFRAFLMVDDGIVCGAAILNIYTELSFKVLNIWAMSHDRGYSDLYADDITLMELAKTLGIRYIVCSGRKGFERTLAKRGWNVEQVLMTKEVI